MNLKIRKSSFYTILYKRIYTPTKIILLQIPIHILYIYNIHISSFTLTFVSNWATSMFFVYSCTAWNS